MARQIPESVRAKDHGLVATQLAKPLEQVYNPVWASSNVSL
jgi:hypothetical protein